MLYFCPKCEEEFATESEGNIIRCTACGFSAKLSQQGKLVHNDAAVASVDDVTTWVKAQVRFAMRDVSEDMVPVVVPVKVRTPVPDVSGTKGLGTQESGQGIMKLDPKGWHFEGVLSGESVSILFPIDSLPAISYDHCDNFQLYHDGNFYMFIPEDDRRKCLKYVILTEGMHWRFATKPLLTPGVNSGFL